MYACMVDSMYVCMYVIHSRTNVRIYQQMFVLSCLVVACRFPTDGFDYFHARIYQQTIALTREVLSSLAVSQRMVLTIFMHAYINKRLLSPGRSCRRLPFPNGRFWLFSASAVTDDLGTIGMEAKALAARQARSTSHVILRILKVVQTLWHLYLLRSIRVEWFSYLPPPSFVRDLQKRARKSCLFIVFIPSVTYIGNWFLGCFVWDWARGRWSAVQSIWYM